LEASVCVIHYRCRNRPRPLGNQSSWRGNPLRVSPFQPSPRKSRGSLPPFLARGKNFALRPRGHTPLDSLTLGSLQQASRSRASRRFPPSKSRRGPPPLGGPKGRFRHLFEISYLDVTGRFRGVVELRADGGESEIRNGSWPRPERLRRPYPLSPEGRKKSWLLRSIRSPSPATERRPG